MKLKPPINQTPETQINEALKIDSSNIIDIEAVSQDAIDEVLNSVGLTEKAPRGDDPNAKFKNFLNTKGGTLEDVAQQVVNIMSRGETEASRLRAAEFIARIQGVQVELDEKPITKDVTINIIGFGNDNKNLLNLVLPKG